MNELSRAKAELESRVEEDQFELDEYMEKQRNHISQVASIQSQLTEANFQVEEMIEVKVSLESKVRMEGRNEKRKRGGRGGERGGKEEGKGRGEEGKGREEGRGEGRGEEGEGREEGRKLLLIIVQVESLQSKISELEEGLSKHQFEASEHKVCCGCKVLLVIARVQIGLVQLIVLEMG